VEGKPGGLSVPGRRRQVLSWREREDVENCMNDRREKLEWGTIGRNFKQVSNNQTRWERDVEA